MNSLSKFSSPRATILLLSLKCKYFVMCAKQTPGAKQTQEDDNFKKNSNNLRLLFQHRFGNQTSFQKNNITNLSDCKLSDTEQFVLSHGLSVCLPPKSIKREEVFADFEVLYAQLDHHKPRSKEQLAALKARLSDLAHAYCGSHIDWGDFYDKRMFSGYRVSPD